MPINILSSLRSSFVYLKTYFVQLNLFYTGVQDEQTIQNERRSTWLYLVLFILSMFISTFYYILIPQTETIIIKSPSFAKYSTLMYQTSLQCPCSKIAIPYNEFIQIQSIYHDICQSNFISDQWINYLYSLYEQSWNNSISSDFRRIGLFQFQTIRSLCQLSKETNQNALRIFLQKEFIQTQLILSDLFQIQINSFITEFINSISKIFLRTLYFVQNTTAQSLLMTGGSLTSILPNNQLDHRMLNTMIPFVGMIYQSSNDSTCTCSSSTATICMVTATFENNNIDGFQTGCYMMNALFKSTLEILYNQSFLNKLTNSSTHFQKLNYSLISNWTIEMLLSRMFVDHWLNTTSYERYFNACTPDLCQYTINRRNDFLQIITFMLGLFGGLSSILHIIASFIISTLWPIVYKLIHRKRMHVNQIIVRQGNSFSRLKTCLQCIKQKLIELNLFKSIPPEQDMNIIRQQHYTTRVHLILLFISLLILIIFTSFRMQTINVTIVKPTWRQFIHLYDRYPLTIHCPCNQTIMKYNQFILYVNPQYHEICSSPFVSPDWINLKFIKSSSSRIWTYDIRSQLQTHFQLLATLCHVSNEIVDDNLQLFNQTKFISKEVLSQKSFQIQIDLIVEQFKRTISESFQTTLELIKANLEINQFIVPINSDFSRPSVNGDILKLYSNFFSDRPDCYEDRLNGKFDFDKCMCIALSIKECYQHMRIVDENINYIIPGIFYSWFPFQSLLMSTLECLYNNSCLFIIKSFINATISPINFTILNSSSSTDKIEILANRLFIQSWNYQSSFQSYFNQCHPLTCQYSYESRLILIYIITTIIGLFGGLITVSHLLAPRIVKLAPKVWSYLPSQQRDNTTRSSSIKLGKIRDRFRCFVKFISRTIIELDLFPSIPPSQDQKIVRRNRYTTRMYLILLIIAIIIVLIYTSLRRDTITVVVKSPSLSTYAQLYSQYPITLQCPCTHIAIKYDKFISQFEPQYHEICSSHFVSSEWIESLYLKYESENYGNNFRAALRLQFPFISKLCILSQKNANVISRKNFDVQTEVLFEQFKRTSVEQFIRIFKLIQVTNHGNQLATAFQSNWWFILKYSSKLFNESTSLPVLTLARIYGADNCSCAIHPNCSELVILRHRASNQSLKQTISGFRVGCLPLDALFQSSLSCLYNQSCLDMMRAVIYYSKPVPVDILTYSSLIEPNTTIETILSQLSVLKWSYHFSFDRYFNECKPQSCQYSYSIKYSRIYVITTLIAQFGGLKDGLYFIISCMALVIFKLYDYLKEKKNNVVAPHLEQSNGNVIDNKENTFKIAVDSINQQSEFRTTRKERVYLVCLILLIILAIVIASTVWFISGGNKVHTITLSSTTIISNTEITSTTTHMSSCHMTLKHQVQTYLTGLDPKSLIINDFNRDSILDLAVTNYGNHTFSILLGNGNATFQMQRIFSTGNMSAPWGIASGDFNNDTLLDLVISLSETSEIAIFYGIKTNALFIHSFNMVINNLLRYVTPLGAIETADLNDDGLIDLVVGNDAVPWTWDTGPTLIFFNTGDNRQFEIDSRFEWFESNILIAIGDFDNEGKQNDIGLFSVFNVLYIFKSPYCINEYLHKHEMYEMFERSSSVTKGRFDDDELEDLAFVFPKTSTLQILLAYGDGTFTQEIYPTASYPTSVTRINFNNDQIDDLAVLSCNRTVTIFLGTSIGFFNRNYLSFEPNERNSTQCAHSLKVADLNGDGRDDLVFIDTEIHSIGVLLGTNYFDEI